MTSLHTAKQRVKAGEVLYVTEAGRAAIRRRLEKLDAERIKLEAELAYSGQDYPDLRENATFGDIKVKLEFELPKLVYELRDLYERAETYVPRSRQKVDIGAYFAARVEWPNSTQTTQRYLLAGPVEAKYSDAPGNVVISYESPLGQAVWGQKQGQEISFQAPQGEAKVHILRLGLDAPEA